MLNYKVLDSGDFEKLEVIGNFTLIRPSLNSPYPKKIPNYGKVLMVIMKKITQDRANGIYIKKLKIPLNLKYMMIL